MEYRIERLSEAVEVCVTKEHGFGTDALLLSEFAAPDNVECAVDLCTGCGIVALLWFSKSCPPKKVYAVDIQDKAIEQLEISIRNSSLEDKIIPLLADLKELSGGISLGSAGLVTCNPPYKPLGRGVMSSRQCDVISRHETMCDIYDVCKTASKLLRPGGRLCLCHRPERLCDVLEAMRAAGIEPKRLRFVHQRTNMPPWLFLIEGSRGGKRHMNVCAPLIIGMRGEMISYAR